MLHRDIDEILTKCCSVVDKEYHLKTLGYRLERRFYYDHPTVIADGWKRAVRISSLGEQYSKENIKKRLLENQQKYGIYSVKPP